MTEKVIGKAFVLTQEVSDIKDRVVWPIVGSTIRHYTHRADPAPTNDNPRPLRLRYIVESVLACGAHYRHHAGTAIRLGQIVTSLQANELAESRLSPAITGHTQSPSDWRRWRRRASRLRSAAASMTILRESS